MANIVSDWMIAFNRDKMIENTFEQQLTNEPFQTILIRQ